MADVNPGAEQRRGGGPLRPPEGDLVLSCAQMRSVDQAAVARTGLPSLLLMENAGRGIAEIVWARLRERQPDRDGSPAVAVVVCGSGNNGGDGFVVARHLVLLAAGLVQVRVLTVIAPDRLAGDAATMFGALQHLPGVEVGDLSAVLDAAAWNEAVGGADVIVDAIFGTGLRSDVKGVAAIAIGAINAAPGITIAIDIPSGLDGDSGQVRGVAVGADVTVTIAARKLGLVINPEAPVGELVMVPLGVPIEPDAALAPFAFWTDKAFVRASLPVREGAAHKGTGGHLLLVAGSPGKTGAALLSSRAALRGGAGLVTVASTAAGRAALDAKVVEAMTISYADAGGDGNDAAGDSFDKLAAACAQPSIRAVAVGPGIPVGPLMRDVVRRLAGEIERPMVLDADALNLLGGDAAGVLSAARGPRVVTPHPGEMGRLAGLSTAAVQADRLGTARRFAMASGAVVVLKGARTLVVAPDGTAFINPAVEPALATAGSGDVLTGLLGALLSQGMPPLAAARAAVFLHGCAGTEAASLYGSTGVVAGDLPEAIAVVRTKLSASPAAPAEKR